MSRSEEALSRAKRHVREGEARVARQFDTVERLDRAGNAWAVQEATRLLVNVETGLDLAREHLRRERARTGGR